MHKDSQFADYEQFTEMFLRNEQALRAFSRSLVLTWYDADELVQEVALTAWQKFDEFEAKDADSFIKWLCVIARFKALHHRRRYARERLVFQEDLIELMAEEGAEENAQRSAEYQALEACMANLPDKQQRLVRLAYATGASIKEEAERQGLRPNTVYVRLNRIRGSLFNCIQQRLAREGFA
jgi:RNA polymerase sigma-70 factor (ECF subfamily)